MPDVQLAKSAIRSIKRRLEDPQNAKEARIKTDAQEALNALEEDDN